MRCSAVISSLIAVATATNWAELDTKWATHPDKTTDWYNAHGEAVPEVASTITTVEEGKSYVVKMECVGCPFRVREIGQVYETWQRPSQDNSLLLNFTLRADSQALLLYNQPIAPLAPMPVAIQAFQTPANLSKNTMEKIVKTEMLDESFVLGTKFAKFELQYEHSVVRTRERGQAWIQFDITAVHMRSSSNPGSYNLNLEGQKMVQLLLKEDEITGNVRIEDVQVVERKDRVMPFQMKCGRFAIFKSSFNPLEWDYYGQFGTSSRSWNMFLHGMRKFFMGPGLLLVIFTVIVGAVKLAKRSIAKRREEKIEDAEIALLESECEDALPEYDDVPEFEDKA